MADSIFLDPGKSLKSNSGIWYRIVQLIAPGGNAVTFLVVATSGPNKGVLFALKIFRLLSKPERRDKFIEEIKFLEQCSHPSIMRIYDTGLFNYTVAGEPSEYPFVVAEYLPRTLREVMRSRSATLAQKASFAVQLLSGLVFLQSQEPQVVHRDIKPENIFVKGASCVLGDFGLMKRLDGSMDEDRNVFKESIGPGMPFFYRTPDLVSYARQERDLTVKSDVFQLGLNLAELFTGWNPCKRPSNDDHLSPVELEELASIPSQHGRLIAPPIKRMLTMEPDNRVSASDVMDQWMGAFEKIGGFALQLEGKVF